MRKSLFYMLFAGIIISHITGTARAVDNCPGTTWTLWDYAMYAESGGGTQVAENRCGTKVFVCASDNEAAIINAYLGKPAAIGSYGTTSYTSLWAQEFGADAVGCYPCPGGAICNGGIENIYRCDVGFYNDTRTADRFKYPFVHHDAGCTQCPTYDSFKEEPNGKIVQDYPHGTTDDTDRFNVDEYIFQEVSPDDYNKKTDCYIPYNAKFDDHTVGRGHYRNECYWQGI